MEEPAAGPGHGVEPEVEEKEMACPSWVVDMERKLGLGDTHTASRCVVSEQWEKKNHSIYRVPERMKNTASSRSKAAYRPELVSLGPFHHGEPDLLPMEEHKDRALRILVRRSGKPLREFAAAVEEAAPRLAEAYDYDWRGVNREWFVKLMLTDGCFLLEVMRASEKGCRDAEEYGYLANDPVFSKHGFLYLFNAITYDTLVVENQLPLLLLQKLVAVQDDACQDAQAINEKVLTFLRQQDRLATMDKLKPHSWHYCHCHCCHCWVGLRWGPRLEVPHVSGSIVKDPPLDELGLHPLDIFHKSFTQSPVEPNDTAAESNSNSNKQLDPPKPLSKRARVRAACRDRTLSRSKEASTPSKDDMDDDDDSDGDLTMHSAVELHEAGVHFSRSDGNRFQDITFERGVLSIPEIAVDDFTERKLLNLMAFEQLHVGAGNDVTAYVFFLDNIVDTGEDVALLRSKKIIDNLLGSNQEVAKLFNTLANGATLDPSSSLHKVKRQVNAYCRKRRNRWRAYFMHTYMRNPWVFISLVAAAILLIATLLQTVYSVLSFYKS